eukprot:TRINITY_DN16184_c0_g1_i1.p1 TRINITY_DN16184_c0_g1~~TRINITY_DN16184_c0_g1_i1.p1  ORF type:complete len:609 (+),score=110.39 TRINITY_DN16184_c0_g1_i1:81-1829(+)
MNIKKLSLLATRVQCCRRYSSAGAKVGWQTSIPANQDDIGDATEGFRWDQPITVIEKKSQLVGYGELDALKKQEPAATESALVLRMLSKKEMQHLIADSLTPYDQLDPVLLSALLRDDLDNFLQKCGVTKEEFDNDYITARDPKTTSYEIRQKFVQKYRFNPYSVTYKEEAFTIDAEEVKKLRYKTVTVAWEKTSVSSEYRSWEQKMREVFDFGFSANDLHQIKQLLSGPKMHSAISLYQHNVLGSLYKVFMYTGRIDGLAAEKMFSPRYLPTWSEVDAAFRLDLKRPSEWKPTTPVGIIEKVRLLDDYNRDYNGYFHNVSFATFMSYFTDMHISALPLKYHCKCTGNLIVFTKEFIDSLAAYIVERSKTYKSMEVPIVEVGSGSGKLSYFLNENQAIKDAGITVVATDQNPVSSHGLIGIPKQDQKLFDAFKNEKLTQDEAIAKYRPAIIIAQMMPNGVDWTEHWRSCPFVLEYILIGLPDSPTSGRPWHTWGVQWGDARSFRLTPPHIKDGFKKTYLDNISRYIIGQDEHAQCQGLNRAVSFKRLTLPEHIIRRYIMPKIVPTLFVSFFVSLAYMSVPDE